MYKQSYLAKAAFAAMAALSFGEHGPLQIKQKIDAPIFIRRGKQHHGWDRKKSGLSPRVAMRAKSRSRRVHASKRHAA
jgi:hypothetical protein